MTHLLISMLVRVFERHQHLLLSFNLSLSYTTQQQKSASKIKKNTKLIS